MHDGVFDPLMSRWEDECAKTSGTATYVPALMEKMSRHWEMERTSHWPKKQLTMRRVRGRKVGEGKAIKTIAGIASIADMATCNCISITKTLVPSGASWKKIGLICLANRNKWGGEITQRGAKV